MNERRKLKQQLFVAQSMLRVPASLTPLMKTQLSERESRLKDDLKGLRPTITPELIQERRSVLRDNHSLHDIFHTLWQLVADKTNDGYLSKEGYMRFHRAVYSALVGPSISGDRGAEEIDWNHDLSCFGPLNMESFFDMLFELIDTWSELVDLLFYAAFAWTLLDSVADVHKFPLRFRPLNEIPCITHYHNTAEVLGEWLRFI